MDIAELKELEAKATPVPWQVDFGHAEGEPMWMSVGPRHVCECPDPCFCDDPGEELEQKATADAKLLATLRNLAPELISLWEVAEKEACEVEDCANPTCKVLKALNSKARSMVI